MYGVEGVTMYLQKMIRILFKMKNFRMNTDLSSQVQLAHFQLLQEVVVELWGLLPKTIFLGYFRLGGSF